MSIRDTRNVIKTLCKIPTQRLITDVGLHSHLASSLLENESLIELLKDFKAEGHVWRFKTCLILGTAIEGDTFLKDVEANRLLLPKDAVEKKFMSMLQQLHLDLSQITSNEAIINLRARLTSYISYCHFHRSVEDKLKVLDLILKKRSKALVRSLLTLSELSFLVKHLKLQRLCKSSKLMAVLNDFNTPEEFSSIVSYLICRANEQKPINAAELMEDVDSHIESDEVEIALRLGTIMYTLNDTAKAITLFGYTLQMIKNGKKYVFKLAPPSADFERFQKMGFIRQEIIRPLSFFHATDAAESQPVSMNEVTKLVVKKAKEVISEWVQWPYPRVRLKFPILDGKHILSEFAKSSYIEDATYYDTLAHEYLLPLDMIQDIKLGNSLDIKNFMNIRRAICFNALLNTSTVTLYNDEDKLMSYNSLVRAMTITNFIEELSYYGFDKKIITEFLSLVSWDVEENPFYDIQYRPLIKLKDHYIFLPVAFYLSDLLRNTQVSNKIRVKGQGELFNDVCKRVIENNFQNVVCNRRVKLGKSTDIDIAVLEGNSLYLFECKHSIPPCNYHEMRDIWRDIEKGVTQLKLAQKILSDTKRLASYLAGWFPGTKVSNIDTIDIKPCILCTHRIFSGMTFQDIPIRDLQSFLVLMQDRPLSLSFLDLETKKVKKILYSSRTSSDLSTADLDEYLSNNAKFFAHFKQNMPEVTILEYLVPNRVTLAKESFVYSVYFGEGATEYIAQMDSLGFRRLPDEHSDFVLPLSDIEMMETWAASGTPEESP